MNKVSVIIPVYNAEKYIRRCLRSILTQSYEDYEIICVEDAGNDNSKEILKEFEERYPDKIRIVYNDENMGPGLCRDKAIKLAAGEYICFIDADDYLLPDYILQYVTAMEKEKCDVIIGGYRLDADGTVSIHHITDNVWACVTYVVAWSKLYKKEFILDSKMTFGDFTCLEDMHFNLIGYMNRIKYKVIDYAGYIHYDNKLSVTAKSRNGKGEDSTKYVMDVFDSLMNMEVYKGMSQTTQWTLQYAYVANIVNALVVYSRGLDKNEIKERIDRCIDDMKSRFPGIKKNPYLKGVGPQGQTAKIRLGVGAFMGAHRLGLEKWIQLIGD